MRTTYAGDLVFVALLMVTPVVGAPAPPAPKIQAPANQTSPQPGAPAALPLSPPTAAQKDNDVSAIAQFAIAAARETTETVKWIFTIGTGAIALVFGALSWIGVHSLKQAVDSAKATANERLAEAVRGAQSNASAQFEQVEAQLLEHLQSCNIVCVRSLETVRLTLLAEQWDVADRARLESFRAALQSVLEVQDHASKVKGLERSFTWAVGMEAYICDKLGNYDGAIAAQCRAMELASPARVHSEHHFQYNLACYYAKAGRLDEAIEPLRQALIIGGNEARMAALREADFEALKVSSAHAEQLRDLLRSASPAPEEPGDGLDFRHH